MRPRYLTIGRIAKPQGIRGEVIVNIETDFPSRFFESNGFFLRARDSDEEPRFVPADAVRPHRDRIVIKFQGVDSRTDAELLRDMELVIPVDDRNTDDDYFHHFELEGMQVDTIDGRHLGKVHEVMLAPHRDILIVRGKDRELLIPFAREICVDVDRDRRRIQVDLPEGLETINN